MNNKQSLISLAGRLPEKFKGRNDSAFTDRALTVDEVADKFNVSRRTVYRMAKQDGFPVPRRISKAVVRWMESEIDAWLGQQGQTK